MSERKAAPKGTASSTVHEELLRVYYVERAYFNCREFAFESGPIFARYISFKDARAMHEFLMKQCPQKMDIGAVYNVDPSKRSTYTGMGDGFYCRERELVFDIDMDEYDDVRTCCKEGKMCHKDWAYMAAAIQVIDSSLRQDFGFEHIMWVYSGRRGIHCWVCDKRARVLADKERAAVADFLTVYKGRQKGTTKLQFSNRGHPSIDRAFSICNKIWIDQCLFESPEHSRAIYDLLGDPRIQNGVSQTPMAQDEDVNQHTWHCIKREVDKLKSSDKDGKHYDTLMRNCEKVILTHVYPRLDVLVSRTMNHLLKAPFCVHPKTGRVCVPIDVGALWEFNPEEVPTVQELYNELNEKDRSDQVPLIRTALDSYIRYFQRFVESMKTSNEKDLDVRAKARH